MMTAAAGRAKFTMRDNKLARLLAYVTGLVNQRLLLQDEYLITENRILRGWLLLLRPPEHITSGIVSYGGYAIRRPSNEAFVEKFASRHLVVLNQSIIMIDGTSVLAKLEPWSIAMLTLPRPNR